jgi:hypothetical protein
MSLEITAWADNEEKKCWTCEHWTSMANREMAKQGYARCALGPKWTFFAPGHACSRHKLVQEIGPRRVWLQKLGHLEGAKR